MTYTQFMSVSSFMEQMLNDYNKHYANNQWGKMNYVLGMIHGLYTTFQLCGGDIKIMHRGTNKDGNPTQFIEMFMDYKCHQIHKFMKIYMKMGGYKK